MPIAGAGAVSNEHRFEWQDLRRNGHCMADRCSGLAERTLTDFSWAALTGVHSVGVLAVVKQDLQTARISVLQMFLFDCRLQCFSVAAHARSARAELQTHLPSLTTDCVVRLSLPFVHFRVYFR
jgi:hypothetical protein